MESQANSEPKGKRLAVQGLQLYRKCPSVASGWQSHGPGGCGHGEVELYAKPTDVLFSMISAHAHTQVRTILSYAEMKGANYPT